MRLNQRQNLLFSKYFTDLSKLLVVSAGVGYFIPASSHQISILTFLVGLSVAIFFLLIGLKFLK